MKQNAITMKDMHTASRSNKTLAGLILIVGTMAAVAMAVYGFMNYAYSNYDYDSMSLETFITVFAVMGYGIFGIYNLIVPIIAGSAIAAEREKQTLEILLTTKLSPFQIVFGKMKAILYKLTIYYAVMLPIIGIVMTVGGVRFYDILLLYIVSITMSFMIGAIGMWSSCLVKKSVVAILLSYFICGIVELGPIIAVSWIAEINAARYIMTNTIPTFNAEIIALLLITPGITVFAAVSSVISGNIPVTDIIYDIIYNSIQFNHPRVLDFLVEHWLVLSIVVQIAIGFFFLFLASKSLNPVARANVRKKGRDEQSSGTTRRRRRTASSNVTEEKVSEESTSDNIETAEETV